MAKPKRPLTDAAVLKQLKAVGEQLATKDPGAKRMALLRKQAALVDLRDAAAERVRRQKAS